MNFLGEVYALVIGSLQKIPHYSTYIAENSLINCVCSSYILLIHSSSCRRNRRAYNSHSESLSVEGSARCVRHVSQEAGCHSEKEVQDWLCWNIQL